ncbi:MAG: ATP-binding protein [Candidatus Marinamargulisbacteria bacterium]
MLLERLNGQPENVEFSIPCMSDYVGVVRLAVSGLATRMNFSIEEIEDIKIAVSEACTNSVQYAYETPEKERVFISFNLFKNKLEIIVKDTGKGFKTDVLERTPIDERSLDDIDENVPRLGLGLTFIKSLMDEITITSELGNGTTIQMAKHI